MDLAASLEEETKKWTKKLEKELPNVKITDRSAPFITNIGAYIKDSKHFAEKGDPIRSFEAIIWAWAWLEILKELEMIK